MGLKISENCFYFAEMSGNLELADYLVQRVEFDVEKAILIAHEMGSEES
jgi:hypothetical protein